MVRTDVEPLLSELTTLDKTTRLRQQRRALNILLLLLLLGFFLMSFERIVTYEKDVVRSSFTIQGNIPVPVLEIRPARGETRMVAVVAHGFSGSKELMSSIGVELAQGGVTTYLFDFPGHGEAASALHFNNQKQLVNGEYNINALDQVVQYVRKNNKVTKEPRIILIGHSMGSSAVNSYAITHAADKDLISTVLISPVSQESATKQVPSNLLLLVGQYDIDASLSDGERLMREGCDIKDGQAVPRDCSSPDKGTGRRLAILPNQNHISILNAASTYQETLSWLHQVEPQIKTNTDSADVRTFWLLLGAASIILAIFPLIFLLMDIINIVPLARVVQGSDVIIFHLCLAVGIAAAVGIQRVWRPFSFLSILIADYVCGYFFLTAIITALCFFLVRNRLPLPPLSFVGRQILLGLALGILLYLTLGELSTFGWQRFTLTLPRMWRFAIIFLAILPLFLLDEGINRGYQARGLVRGIIASLAFKAWLVIGLLCAIIFTPGIGFLSIVLPLLVLLFIILASLCTQLYLSGRAAIAGAFFSAFLVAWCMAGSFPTT